MGLCSFLNDFEKPYMFLENDKIYEILDGLRQIFVEVSYSGNITIFDATSILYDKFDIGDYRTPTIPTNFIPLRPDKTGTAIILIALERDFKIGFSERLKSVCLQYAKKEFRKLKELFSDLPPVVKVAVNISALVEEICSTVSVTAVKDGNSWNPVLVNAEKFDQYYDKILSCANTYTKRIDKKKLMELLLYKNPTRSKPYGTPHVKRSYIYNTPDRMINMVKDSTTLFIRDGDQTFSTPLNSLKGSLLPYMAKRITDKSMQSILSRNHGSTYPESIMGADGTDDSDEENTVYPVNSESEKESYNEPSDTSEAKIWEDKYA